MKKITVLFALATIAVSFGTTAACEERGAACNNDNDCGSDEVCANDFCTAAECEGNTDCDLSTLGDAISIESLDDGNAECEDQGLVTIVTFDGSEACIAGPSDEVGCEQGLSRTDANGPGGSTVEVCASGDGVCSLGVCD